MRHALRSVCLLTAAPLSIVLLGVFAAATFADDWPQWQGPNRTGKSAEKGLAKKWAPGGPPLLWSVNTAGVGYSTPAVAGGKVLLMGSGKDTEWLICYEEKTGKQLWSCAVDRVRSKGGGYAGPRSTPTVADGKVYCLGLAGRVTCCDAATGKPVWWRELKREFGGKEPVWGYSESVLVDEGRVICMPGMEKTVVALDAKTGKEIWVSKAGGDPAAYSSFVKAVLCDVPQYVGFTQRGVIGVRASDGAFLWRYDAPSNGQVNCPTPVCFENTVFAASGYGRGGGCAALTKDEAGKFTVKQVYFTNKMQNLHGGYVLNEGFLYGCSDPGVLACLNYKSGVVARAVQTGRFSIAFADGMLYLRNEDGRMDLYEASSANPTRRGSFEQPQRSKYKAWPHPVIANGRMYLRDQYALLCYDLTPQPEIPGPDGSKKAGAAKKAAETGGKVPPAGSSKEKTPAPATAKPG